MIQYGKVGWCDDPTFSLSMVRQPEIGDSSGDHKHYVQVNFEFQYSLDDELKGMQSRAEWWFPESGDSLQAWLASVGRSARSRNAALGLQSACALSEVTMSQEGPRIKTLLALLYRVPRASGEVIEGAATEGLAELRHVLGGELPPQLTEWLQVCNGTTSGPGGIFGTGTDREHINIEFHIGLYPEWRGLNWMPIGGDGCGNYYMMATSGRESTPRPVFFVDVMDNWSKPSYFVASDLFHFLEFLFEKELGVEGWPFVRRYVEGKDPNISSLEMLPWR
ncbi:SMI1/KNR4 family protein [Actinomadura bangladeshensis]|uniref:SMI1/KNR4 family protein n=1 Tax=Actinomadura bangladeshensis TaxID=453573 RepID=A0A6L9QLA3_9ACTN|nr:SMI1/KNR4 family protein [Actinomadura bangladeshensis]NEA26231.1 SMI1/KNR4 family protein [Actinomadura bangladeshensis]